MTAEATVVRARPAADGAVTVIEIDDGKANALSFRLQEALQAEIATAAAAGTPIVLVGRERTFCAGFDLAVMQGSDGRERARLLQAGGSLFAEIMRAPVPVVAACTGHALAGGALLLLSADVRLGRVGESKIGLNEVRIGITLPPAALAMARERLDRRQLTSALLLAEICDPERAAAVGFLDAVVDGDVVEAAVARAAVYADELDPGAFAASKRLLRAGLLAELEHFA